MRVKKKYSAAQKFQAAMSVIKGEKSAVEAARDLLAPIHQRRYKFSAVSP